MRGAKSYLMENLEEALRLEIKTDPEVVLRQARWCGVAPGFRVLDAGCGPGKITSILNSMVQPGGEILGVDYSEERIRHAEEHYGSQSDITFRVQDLREPLDDMDPFDLIWVRFVLEYNRLESPDIIRNLTRILKPGGTLCLLDLDHNCLNHYELPQQMERVLFELAAVVQEKYNFDPYAGRKLYAHLYDVGYEDIQLDMVPHHLIYGEVGEVDSYNWIKKGEVVSAKAPETVKRYPGGVERFFSDFKVFFHDPRRFTYTPLILCKGRKPLSP
jgi:ubiquinone/menaquinone biosynthesis C-methylase UbiE